MPDNIETLFAGILIATESAGPKMSRTSCGDAGVTFRNGIGTRGRATAALISFHQSSATIRQR